MSISDQMQNLGTKPAQFYIDNEDKRLTSSLCEVLPEKYHLKNT